MSASLRPPSPLLSVIVLHALRGSGPTWHDTVHVSSRSLRRLYWPATQRPFPALHTHTDIRVKAESL